MLGWIVFWIGALADAWTTDYARDRWPVREVNPVTEKLLAWLEDRVGDPAEYVGKAVLGGLLWWVDPPASVLYVLGGFQLAAAGYNWTVIRRLRRR